MSLAAHRLFPLLRRFRNFPPAWCLTFVFALAAAILAWPASVAAETDSSMSRANRLLFDSNHFESLSQPVTLHYRLSSDGRDEEAFDDNVEMRISQGEASKDWRVDIDYLSGSRKAYVPPVTDARGNPVIKVFLQREVTELERLTGGSWRYFQRALKRAFAHSAVVETVRFEFDGREVEGTRIEVTPYRNDPRRQQIGPYATTRYRFILSPTVPGSVYRLEAAMAGGTDEVASREVLTLVRAAPANSR